jgi:hypothetical protein
MAEEKAVPRVRTYERDVAEFMARTGGTAADIALAEQSRRIEKKSVADFSASRPFLRGSTPSPASPAGEETRGEGVASFENATTPPRKLGTPPQPRRGLDLSIPSPIIEAVRARARSLAMWSIVFIVLAGIIGTGYWYLSSLLPKTPITPSTSASASKIILADREKIIDASKLTRDTFISSFNKERANSLPLSSIERISLGKITAEKFLSLISVQIDTGFSRALEPDFELGLRGLPTNSAFLIFKTRYYQTALAGMLSWENTIIDDVGAIFGVPAFGSANFVDKVVKNRDVRKFVNESGKEYLVWGFADKNTIIIADSEDTFLQIMGKLVH